jgi:hypothetical protein
MNPPASRITAVLLLSYPHLAVLLEPKSKVKDNSRMKQAILSRRVGVAIPEKWQFQFFPIYAKYAECRLSDLILNVYLIAIQTCDNSDCV